MAAHKVWRARAFIPISGVALEMSEFHLYNGATRVDAAATLTANVAPTGSLANLKDGNVASGCLWSADATLILLTWTFATATSVDSIIVGSRTTSTRWPTSVVLQGGENTTGTGESPEFTETQFYGLGRFVSATKTARISPTPADKLLLALTATQDLHLCYGTGRIPFQIEKEISPPTDPKTYTPQWAKVYLIRCLDYKVMRVVWSDKTTGLGSFEHIDQNQLYTVVAEYPDTGLRAVIADRIQPENYPV